MTLKPLSPGSTIGVVGGGQLGRMLASAAHKHGYRVVVLSGGEQGSPAGLVADMEIATSFDDPEGIARFLKEADVVTWEFENVNTSIADKAEDAGIPVRPSGRLIATTQDRIVEKTALQALGVPLTPWRIATSQNELESAVDELGLPVIAKTSRFGYDGKGQVLIDSQEQPNEPAAHGRRKQVDSENATREGSSRQADNHMAQHIHATLTGSHERVGEAWKELGGGQLVVEKVVEFEREISVIVARSAWGEVADYGVMENHHIDNVLDTTIFPARIPIERANRAKEIAREIASAWELVGVMCVEMFEVDEELLVNEIAPRPHNSGHCTIESAKTSQFEQQLRAVAGMPLGDTTSQPAAMVQLLGKHLPPPPNVPPSSEEPSEVHLAQESANAYLSQASSSEKAQGVHLTQESANAYLSQAPSSKKTQGVHLHLYGKREARPNRKMGHMTAIGTNPEALLDKLKSLRQALGKPSK